MKTKSIISFVLTTVLMSIIFVNTTIFNVFATSNTLMIELDYSLIGDNNYIVNAINQSIKKANLNINVITEIPVTMSFTHYFNNGGSYLVCVNGYVRILPFRTPNGTNMAGTFENSEINYYVIEWKIEDDFPDTVKNDMAVTIQNNELYSNAQLISEATSQYNCHSYAWYMQDVENNDIWIQYPNIYYSTNDMSYEEVTEPRIGDLICYFDSNETIEELSNVHSGIIIGFSGEESNGVCGDANKYIVRSKWGCLGLYEHRGDQCPDVLGGEIGDAEYVKYYRLRTDEVSEMSISNFKFKGEKQITSRNDIAANGGSKANTYSMYELNVNESGEYTITISAPSPLTISFLDVNRNSFSVTPTITVGNNYVYKFDNYFDEGYYYVRAQIENADASGTIETIVTHKHNYEIYESISDTLHIKKCVCGARGGTHTHVIKSDGLPKRYKPCMYCGHLIDTESGVIIPSIKNRVV